MMIPSRIQKSKRSSISRNVKHVTRLFAQYLGDDLEELQGRTVHDDDSYISLPILSLPGVVLLPGQTLPLHLFQPSTVSMMSHVVENDKTFGIVTPRLVFWLSLK